MWVVGVACVALVACGDSSSSSPDLFVGDAGPDVGVDPCQGVVCASPPASTCADNKTLRRYPLIGTCHAGQCAYEEVQESCSGSCQGGACWQSTTFVYVDARNAGSEAGTAVAPYRDLAQAVDKAVSGTGILVAAGDYPGNVKVDGKVLELVGGYPGGSASAYADGSGGDFTMRDVTKYETTITVSGAGPGLALLQSGASAVAGLTIKGGGRGVYCEGGAPTLRGNRVTGNKSPSQFGGGIFTQNCDMTLIANLIDQNVGSRGGGMASDGGKLLLRGNVFRENEAQEDHGGGFYLTNGEVELRDNRLESNTVGLDLGYGWGGGGALIACQAELSGNVSTDNLATTFGGGLFVDDGTIATLKNELYYRNRCGEGGAGLYVDGLDANTYSKATLINVTIADHPCEGQGNGLLIEKSDVTIRNSIFWRNGAEELTLVDGSLTVRYSRTSSTQSGEGNSGGDPLFAGAGAGAYHLQSTAGRWDGAAWVKDGASSPAIDSGDSADGVGDEPTPNGGRVNLGAFGGTATASKTP